MPAVVPAAGAFLAGLVAGLSFAWAATLFAPVAALAAVALRSSGTARTLLASSAAGMLWGGLAGLERSRDCRLRWAHGDRVALLVEPLDMQFADRPARFAIRAPSRCGGDVKLRFGRGKPVPGGPSMVVGRWQRSENVRPGRPDLSGTVVVEHWRPSGSKPGVRSRLRLSAEARLLALFGERRAGLAIALTVSPDAGLPPEVRERFARAGLAHLLSISGFHVGLLAGALVLVLRVLRLSGDAARVLGTVLVAGYVWMLGLPAPALRSALLLGLWSWARVRQRPPAWPALLATTAVGVSLVNPWAITLPGPWLSFLGVLGCVVGARWHKDLAARAGRPRRRSAAARWLLGALAVSAGATLATAPVSLLAFGSAAPVAAVANLAAVPLAGFAVPALCLALLLAAVPAGASLAALPAAAAGLALDGLDVVSGLAGAVPGGHVMVERRVVAALVVTSGAGVLLRPPRPYSARPLRHLVLARVAVALTVSAAMLSVAGAADRARSGDAGGRLALHFLAVGQGDAAALRTPAGRWVVIDGGPRTAGYDAGEAVVAPFLRRNGVKRVAVLVASHADSDHLGGLPAVLGRVPVDLVLEPGDPQPQQLYREWLDRVERSGARWRRARAGDRIDLDGVTLRVWHPDSAWLLRRMPANENSLVLSVEYGGFRAVFPGDAGLPMEQVRASEIGPVSLLKVGHHGSRSASGDEWLRALSPAVCVVSVGRNRYGHPHPLVVAALTAARCDLWRTDRTGGVTLLTDGRRVTLRSRARRDTTFNLSGEQP